MNINMKKDIVITYVSMERTYQERILIIFCQISKTNLEAGQQAGKRIIKKQK